MFRSATRVGQESRPDDKLGPGGSPQVDKSCSSKSAGDIEVGFK